MTANPTILVYGYGNPGRQDDGLGPAAAAAIERLGLAHVTVSDPYQLAIEDSVDVAKHDLIWFVDATVDGAGRFEISRVLPDPQPSFTSHATSPGTVLALAEAYYGARPPAFQLAIRGYSFALGEGLTDAATDNLAAALSVLEARLRDAATEGVA